MRRRGLGICRSGNVDELTAAGRTPPRVPVRPKAQLQGQTALLRRLQRAGVAMG